MQRTSKLLSPAQQMFRPSGKGSARPHTNSTRSAKVTERYKAPKHSLSCQRMEVVRTQDLENLIHAKDVKALVSSTTNVQALWKGISQSQTPSKSYTPYSTKALINSAAVAEWYKAPKHFLSWQKMLGSGLNSVAMEIGCLSFIEFNLSKAL